MARRWFLGLGANLGDAKAALARTLARLDRQPGSRLVACSSLWRSAPVDAEGPDYLNAVVALDSDLDPLELLALARTLETREGRQRPSRNAPRTLDIDLLLAGQLAIDTADLTLPHPRMHQRAFVLAPLLEIAPEATIPGLGRAALWLERCAAQPIERLGALAPGGDS